MSIYTSKNTLIAGITGSGKSYLENLIIKDLMQEKDALLVLIDPKMVELSEYAQDTKTMFYADDEDGIYDTLSDVYEIMMRRYEKMKAAGMKSTDEPPIYVCVDEMAALLQSERKKQYVKMFSRLALLGRAAGVHLILCTQVATQDVIPACIRDQMTNIICLRQYNQGKYRFLLGEAVTELPMVGYAYLKRPGFKIEKIRVDDVWKKISGKEGM